MEHDWGIHWFRRDLRIPGNEALKANWKKSKGRTLGLFCFDSKFLSRNDFSNNRFALFLNSIKELREDLRQQGGDLLVVDCQPDETFKQVIHFLKSKKLKLPHLVTWNRDYEPFARQRDLNIKKILQELSIPTEDYRDHLLFEPHEITKNDRPSEFYQVYSPYSKRWFEKMHSPEGQSRISVNASVDDYFKRTNRKNDLFKMNWDVLVRLPGFPFDDQLSHFIEENQKKVTISIPEAGFAKAYQQLLIFKDKINSYKDKRDVPSVAGTSRFSIFLKNGSLTVPQIIAALNLQNTKLDSTNGPTQFVKELAWREFYYSILYHRPDVEQSSFLPQYKNLPWENNETYFELWKEGKTGFPIVDAGMRELKTTGWMHNRVRMIVASFLTKDLLIDWRWGENHFMKELLDGDLAPNNGGWQWAASTGCDPQPYFRIFNPWLQSAKFDPDGVYIRKFIPELKSAPAKDLHNPAANRRLWGYPDPIVDHSTQRDKALNLYKNQR